MKQRTEEERCEFCHHTLKNNRHGLDQNDAYLDDATDELIHSGHCTYCKVCMGAMEDE